MNMIRNLPDPVALATRINQLQLQGYGLLHQPSNGLIAPQLSNLDKLLIYSHYIVFSDQAYLDREANARDLHSHLAMFATRAHLSGIHPAMNKTEMNACISNEMSRSSTDVTLGSTEASSASSRAPYPDPSAWPCSAPPTGSSSSEARYEAEAEPGSRTSGNVNQRSDSRGAQPASRNTRPWTKSNRVHPVVSVQPSLSKRPPEPVAREFNLIRSTLARYASDVTREQALVWNEVNMQAAPCRPLFPWSQSRTAPAS